MIVYHTLRHPRPTCLCRSSPHLLCDLLASATFNRARPVPPDSGRPTDDRPNRSENGRSRHWHRAGSIYAMSAGLAMPQVLKATAIHSSSCSCRPQGPLSSARNLLLCSTDPKVSCVRASPLLLQALGCRRDTAQKPITLARPPLDDREAAPGLASGNAGLRAVCCSTGNRTFA